MGFKDTSESLVLLSKRRGMGGSGNNMADYKHMNSIKWDNRGIKYNDNNGMRIRINDMSINI